MARAALIRAAAIGILLAGAIGLVADQAHAADPGGLPPPPVVEAPPSDGGLQFIALGIGKSVVVDLPANVKDVLVADPKIANAVIRSTRRAYLIGVAIGQTNIFFFDANGGQIAGFDIAVKRDLNGVRTLLQRMFPSYGLAIEGVGPDGLILTGVVATPLEAQQAYDAAVRLVGQDAKVVNAITVKGRDQVMLRVTVAEVQRNIVKQLGIDLNGSIGTGKAVLDFNTANPFSISGALSETAIDAVLGGYNRNANPNFGNYLPRLDATLRALEGAGVMRTLAEPNLSAISGESATFLVGGEFPVTTSYSCQGTVCTPAITFKNFGVSLNFTPVVLSAGRISLKVMAEVSELSNEGALTLEGGTTVPALRTRRVDTTVELPSGGALAMAGIIQEQTKQQINGLPGLLRLPVLGTLFRSRDYQNKQTELMVIVAPYVVRPVAPKKLSRPDDGYADMSDPSAILLGRLTRIYGVSGSANPQRTYFGKYGFILD